MKNNSQSILLTSPKNNQGESSVPNDSNPDKLLTLKTIKKLLGYQFKVKKYQRGYKWGQLEVEALLNDIHSFQSEDGSGKFYCLQPIVVRRHPPKEGEDIKAVWELIDGQQRITTIYLILKYLKQDCWSIKYDTRESSSDFLSGQLENIEDGHDWNTFINENKGFDNIDNFHFFQAYQTIMKWFEDKNKDKEFKQADWLEKLLKHTKVIWYEASESPKNQDNNSDASVNQDDDAASIKIFRRLNSGKIPLTNSELIKALFLQQAKDQTNTDPKNILLSKIELAQQWDQIEYALQNDEFWYFLGGPSATNDMPNRIEFIFNILTAKDKKPNDTFHAFNYYNDKLEKIVGSQAKADDKAKAKAKADFFKNEWDKVKKCFATLDEWFHNRVLYHKVGYLLATGTNIKSLIKKRDENGTRTSFLKKLDEKIRDKLVKDWESLEYDDSKIRNILLLHNIQSMLNNENSNARFPFDRYKKENWDIEHINSTNEKMPEKTTHQEDWLKEARKYLPKEKKPLLDDIASFIGNPEEIKFKDLFDRVLEAFSNTDDNSKMLDNNGISNLTLLDRRTNRGYKNAPFPFKRSKIIEREKNGTFIPLCTKNVFMKYYSKNIDNFTFWSEADAEAYLNNMKETFETIPDTNGTRNQND